MPPAASFPRIWYRFAVDPTSAGTSTSQLSGRPGCDVKTLSHLGSDGVTRSPRPAPMPRSAASRGDGRGMDRRAGGRAATICSELRLCWVHMQALRYDAVHVRRYG